MSPGDSEPRARAHDGPYPLDLSSRGASCGEKPSDPAYVYEVSRTAPGSILWRLRIYEPDGIVQVCPQRMVWARTLEDAIGVAMRAIKALR